MNAVDLILAVWAVLILAGCGVCWFAARHAPIRDEDSELQGYMRVGIHLLPRQEERKP